MCEILTTENSFQYFNNKIFPHLFFQTHVCIQQTVIDLIENGYEVHIVADATSSRSQMDRIFALQVKKLA